MASKTRLKYHLIFVTKYRKRVLCDKLMPFVINSLKEQLIKFNIDIIAIEGDDKDHIHMMIEAKPTQSISMIVRHLKQMTTYYAWREYPAHLRSVYWYKNHLWSSGYFCCTTGDASSETVKKYIETQGN